MKDKPCRGEPGSQRVKAIAGFLMMAWIFWEGLESGQCAEQVLQKTNIKTKIQIFADSVFETGIPGFSLEEKGQIDRDILIKRFGQPLEATSIKEPSGDP
ncbi:MAG: hypothetical protein HY760_08080 [Nitrospirae bacterium]|nr:hypothetical protein [Nitrospirota bacterium]